TLRQLFEQLGEQPEQEGRVDARRLVDQAARVEQMDAPAAIRLATQDVGQLQRRLAEEGLGALLFQPGQLAQKRLRRGLGEQRGVLAKRLGGFQQVTDQRLEILQIEQQQTLAVGNLEHRLQRSLLAVGQLQQVAEQQRT